MGHLQKTFETAVSDIFESVERLRGRSQISDAAVGVTLEIDSDKGNLGMIESPQNELLGVKATISLQIPASQRPIGGFQPAKPLADAAYRLADQGEQPPVDRR